MGKVDGGWWNHQWLAFFDSYPDDVDIPVDDALKQLDPSVLNRLGGATHLRCWMLRT